MPDIKRTDPEYWVTPERFEVIRDQVPPGANVAYHHLGAEGPDTPVCVVLEMAPGQILPRHAHSAERFEIIARGTLETEDGIYEPGDIMIARANELYGPKVAGPDGCLTCEVFSNELGASEVILELKDETRRLVKMLEGEIVMEEPADLAGLEWALRRHAEIAGADSPLHSTSVGG